MAANPLGNYWQGVDEPSSRTIPRARARSSPPLRSCQFASTTSSSNGSRRLAEGPHSPLTEFLAQLTKRAGHVARAWRLHLDPQGHGRLSQSDFCAAARRLGYAENIRSVWEELDSYSVQMVTLAELDWRTADTLGRFYHSCVKSFGGIARAAHGLEFQEGRKMSREAFVARVVVRGLADQRDAEELFQMLRSSAVGDSRPVVTRDEMLWLGKMAEYSFPKPAARVRPGALQEPAPSPISIDDGYPFAEQLERKTYHPAPRGLKEASLYGGSCGSSRLSRSMSASAFPRSMSAGRAAATLSPWALNSGSPASSAFSPAMTSDISTDYGWAPEVETVHERLYRDGLEYQQRRIRDVEAARMLEIAPKVAILDANPELFNRLHKDFERIQERKKNLAEHHLESMVQPPQDPRRCRTQDGLVCHDKTAFERLLQPREKGEADVPVKPQIRDDPAHRCVNLYNQHREQLAKAAEKDRVDAENAMKEAAAAAAKRQRAPNFHHLQRLYDQHAKTQDKIEKQREHALAAEMEALGGKKKKKACGGSPALDSTFLRLHMHGMQRDHQIAQKRAQADREEETKLKDMSIHRRRASADTDVFDRLYGGGQSSRIESRGEEEAEVWRRGEKARPRVEDAEILRRADKAKSKGGEEIAEADECHSKQALPVWIPPPMVRLPSAAEVTQQVFAELGLSLDVEGDNLDKENNPFVKQVEPSSDRPVDSCATSAYSGGTRRSSCTSTCSTNVGSSCSGVAATVGASRTSVGSVVKPAAKGRQQQFISTSSR